MFARTFGLPMVMFISVTLLSLIGVVVVGGPNYPRAGGVVFLSAGLAALATAWAQTKIDPRLLLTGFQTLVAVAIVLLVIIWVPLQVVLLWPLAVEKGILPQLLLVSALAWFVTVGCVARIIYLERKRRAG